MFNQTFTYILNVLSISTDLCVGDAPAHYEGVALAAGVPVAVHPVTSLATPGAGAEDVS